MDSTQDAAVVKRLRRAVLLVAGLNFGYFFVEFGIALAIGSVSLLADSVDFLEDTSVNLLIAIALGLPLAKRALAGKAMGLIILLPAAAAAWKLVEKFGQPTPPDVLSLCLTAGGAVLVNLTCSIILARFRDHGGSMSTAAFLAARNDVIVNVAIVVMGFITLWTGSGWPDIVLGAIIILLAAWAAHEVWEVAEEEQLAAKALAGEEID